MSSVSVGSGAVNGSVVASLIANEWKSSVCDALSRYIAVPNQSPMFDPNCLTNGLQDEALDILLNWVKTQTIAGFNMEVVREPERTPLVLITIDGDSKTDETVLMYGHMDKQPPMTEHWHAGLGPFSPVIKDGKLYGRGGADDGYAIFAALLAVRALQEQKVPHARIVIIVEACEESGSKDLPFYIEKLAPRIGTPSLVICLDSGCGNYEQMWLTTSLRGLIVGTLEVKILTEAVHSGMASGIVPSTFRIARQILDRIENSQTGELAPLFYVDIPQEHLTYANEVASTVGAVIHEKFPFVPGAKPISNDLSQLLLNSTWRPALSVTGADGLPPTGSAGNVLRTETRLKLSIRLPPTLTVEPVITWLKNELERDAPYGAHVQFVGVTGQKGWCAPRLDEWLQTSVNNASLVYFKKPVRLTGEGGSIPFMGMLGQRYPKTQFVITGLLGPSSNAHGPNEFLHIGMFHGLTGCVTNILADHFAAKVTHSS